jgi:hypothetical protein
MRWTIAIAALAVLLVTMACGATRLQRAWIAPDVTSLRIHKVVAVALSRNPDRRRAMETSIVDQFHSAAPQVQATPSSTLISDSELRNEAVVRERLEQAGFDAQVVMRVTDVNRRDVYIPGRTSLVPEYYRTFWGYYRYWVPIAYQPGYIERDRDVEVETALYDTAQEGRLVYSAVSRTLNPSSAADLAKDVTHEVVKDIKDKGLLH